jgi:hypothetical protein
MVPILRLLCSALGKFLGIAEVIPHPLAHRPAVIPSSLRSLVTMSINCTTPEFQQAFTLRGSVQFTPVAANASFDCGDARKRMNSFAVSGDWELAIGAAV